MATTKTIKTKETKVNDESDEICKQLSRFKRCMNSSTLGAGWDEVGECSWYQIRGLPKHVSIVIKSTGVGKRMKFEVTLLSIQGTEITMPFSDFQYEKKKDSIICIFTNGDYTCKHVVDVNDL